MNVVLSNYDISLSYINYVPSQGILAWTRLDLFNYMLNPKSSYIQSLSKSSPASAAKWILADPDPFGPGFAIWVKPDFQTMMCLWLKNISLSQ